MSPQTPCPPDNGHRRARFLWRLLLAALLTCAPLLSAAQGQPFGSGDMTAKAAGGVAAMPCHSDAGEPATAAHSDCPHCNGDAPRGQCQCCDLAAPAGLPGSTAGAPPAVAGDRRPHRALTDTLPRSPQDRLYRPPIHAS